MTIGAYEIICRPTGLRYIGSSGRSIENRLANHWATLKNGKHPNPRFLAEYREHGKEAFTVRVYETSAHTAEEDRLLKYWSARQKAYNKSGDHKGAGGRVSEETKLLMSESARERNALPHYNKMLSTRAKAQHANGKLGRATWKTEGNFPKGSEHKAAKLTEEDVLAIRAEPRTYGYQVRLATKYGVTQVCISRIILCKCWTHI